MKKKLSISLVLFNNEIQLVKNVLNSCIKDVSAKDIYVVDNSINNELEIIKSIHDINYFKNKNKGFGQGHNVCFKNFNLLDRYHYTLIINPDTSFKKNTLSNLVKFLDKNSEVGAVMPKIVNFDGSLQFARRCLPTPAHLIFKKLFPISKISKQYELQENEPTKPVELIAISGCFMLVRNQILKKIGLFDERFFMYFEDLDLARRISVLSKIIYYPLEIVSHQGQREHKKSFKLFIHLILSAIKYFLKWGIFDDYRDISNKKVQKEFKKFGISNK